LIENSDVTSTVYISFLARAAASSQQLQPVVSKSQCFSLFSFSDYPTIMAEKFEGGQIASTVIHSLLLKVDKIKITVITHNP